MLRRRESVDAPDLRFGAVGALALLVALSGLPAGAAEIEKNRALDCNSDITIGQALNPPVPVLAPARVDVTLTVENTLSTDALNNNVDQIFDVVAYFPDCMTTIPCVPSATVTAAFVAGSVGGTCPAPVMVNDLGGQINFVYDLTMMNPGPPGLTLGPNMGAGGPAPGESCTLEFQVDLATPGKTYTSEATSRGVCQDPFFPLGDSESGTTVTSNLMFMLMVPTLGEIAMWILALALVVGSMWILRRRSVSA